MAYQHWTLEELEILSREYPIGGSSAVLKLMPYRSLLSIQQKAKMVGMPRLRKAREPKQPDPTRRITHPAPGVTVHRLL